MRVLYLLNISDLDRLTADSGAGRSRFSGTRAVVCPGSDGVG